MKFVKLPLANDKAIFVNPEMVLSVQPIANARTMIWLIDVGGGCYDIPLPVADVIHLLTVYTLNDAAVIHTRTEILSGYLAGIRDMARYAVIEVGGIGILACLYLLYLLITHR